MRRINKTNHNRTADVSRRAFFRFCRPFVSQVSINIKLSASSEYSLDLTLCDRITPQETTVTFLATKVEIKLKKEHEGTRWSALERPQGAAEVVVARWDDASKVDKHLYPTSSKIKKNWDSIAKTVCVFLPLSLRAAVPEKGSWRWRERKRRPARPM